MISTHTVNIDAIRKGVHAFIETYPHPVAERRPPRGVHPVLWVDDFWRGVDVAQAVLDEEVAGWRRVRIEDIGDRAPGDVMLVARLDGVVRATMAVVVARTAGKSVTAEADENADHDLADILLHAFDNISLTGDPEHWNLQGHADSEIEGDDAEEA